MFSSHNSPEFFTNRNDISSNKTSSEYIIKQNEFFHSKIYELEQQIHKLDNEIQTLESDNESLEKSKTNLKGYISNQSEYNIMSKKLVHFYDLRMNSFKNHFDLLFKYIWFVIAVYIIQFSYVFLQQNIYQNFVYCFINACFFYVCKKSYVSFNTIYSLTHINNDGQVITIKKEIEQSEQGNFYLRELVDII